MNKLNIKPLKYLNELNNTIKMIKYDKISYNDIDDRIIGTIWHDNNIWKRDYIFYYCT